MVAKRVPETSVSGRFREGHVLEMESLEQRAERLQRAKNRFLAAAQEDPAEAWWQQGQLRI